MFLLQLKASSRSNAVEEVATVVTDVADAVVTDATRSVIPSGRSGLSRSAACPRP
jgi:hypothetical protein